MSQVLSILGPTALILIILTYAFLWYNKNHKAIKAFTIWLIFTVSIALMPIILNAILVYFFMENRFTLSSTLIKGELFIVSVAVGSDAIGRIFASDTKDDISAIAPAGGSFVLVIISSFLFAIFSAPFESDLNTENVPIVSTVIFFMTILLSGVCVLRTEV